MRAGDARQEISVELARRKNGKRKMTRENLVAVVWGTLVLFLSGAHSAGGTSGGIPDCPRECESDAHVDNNSIYWMLAKHSVTAGSGTLDCVTCELCEAKFSAGYLGTGLWEIQISPPGQGGVHQSGSGVLTQRYWTVETNCNESDPWHFYFTDEAGIVSSVESECTCSE
jgi:hypothetical protein